MSRLARAPLFVLIALVGALVITRGLVSRPGYTDAYYHFNAANRLVSGQGLTDPYLWTYIAAPDTLPAPAYLYWMPLTALLAASGMWLFNAPGDYYTAQMPFALLFAAAVCVGYWLGWRLGKTRRHAWVAGLVTLFSGFFTRFWGATDTFAPYALVGSLCLVFLGLAVEANGERRIARASVWFALAGALAALGHLTRADGLLLLVAGWAAILWPSGAPSVGQRVVALIVFTLTYLAVMTPWFIRNLNEIRTLLPVGGAQGIWYTEYNDIFNYPPDSNPQTFFASGVGAIVRSRWEGFASMIFGTFLAVEGMVAMTPLVLIGLWRRRRDGFLRGFGLYALGLHLVMVLVFPYPGYRGGLFHSAAALVPWWAALGVVGLDDVVEWAAQRRPRWKPAAARSVFSMGLVMLAVLMSILNAVSGRVDRGVPDLYPALMATLPQDARLMINDPAALYYFTGMSSVVIPNEAPDVIPIIARQYDIDYLVLELVSADGAQAGGAPAKLWLILTEPPEFLEPLPFDVPDARLYAIRH